MDTLNSLRTILLKQKSKYHCLEDLVDSFEIDDIVRDIININKYNNQQSKVNIEDLIKYDPDTSVSKIIHSFSKHTSLLNPVEIYTPDNHLQYKEIYLNNKDPKINPIFEYNIGLNNLNNKINGQFKLNESLAENIQFLNIELDILKKQIMNIDTKKDKILALLKLLLYDKVNDDIYTIGLLNGLSKKDDLIIKRNINLKYNYKITKKVLNYAVLTYQYLLANKFSEKTKLKDHDRAITPNEFKKMIQTSLEIYYDYFEKKYNTKFPLSLKYKVEIDPNIIAIDVRDKSSNGPQIKIPNENKVLSRCFTLIRHEIDEHVRNSLNGYFVFKFGGGLNKVDDELLYEGLAMYYEKRFAEEYIRSKETPPLPYPIFAMYLAEMGYTFLDIYCFLNELIIETGYTQEQAKTKSWKTTLRVFRGHIDTTNIYAYANKKDLSYLRGWIIVNQLAKNNLLYLTELSIYNINSIFCINGLKNSLGKLPFNDLNTAKTLLGKQKIK